MNRYFAVCSFPACSGAMDKAVFLRAARLPDEYLQNISRLRGAAAENISAFFCGRPGLEENILSNFLDSRYARRRQAVRLSFHRLMRTALFLQVISDACAFGHNAAARVLRSLFGAEIFQYVFSLPRDGAKNIPACIFSVKNPRGEYFRQYFARRLPRCGEYFGEYFCDHCLGQGIF
ncbi:MAG: hypothetical protein Q4F72_02510 [Desulfovibrionaceae bacterium]|nr:hypothetical protein [Desulfovibrionaceae bacterium]